MQRIDELTQHDSHSYKRDTGVSKRKLDTLVLGYMVKRLHLAVQSCASLPAPLSPSIGKLPERNERLHRVVLYQPQELLLKRRFLFVGFVSKMQQDVEQDVIHEIGQVDAQLIEVLATYAGILSYSSLELRQGQWCNLVILDDTHAKKQIKEIERHTYAVHHLAHNYYDWIRLHHGILFEGLDCTEMRLQKTKYYAFQKAQHMPVMREDTYIAIA